MSNGRTHKYHSEAKILQGHLSLPLPYTIDPQAHANLAGEGGYFAQRLDKYRLESVISIDSGYTHVAGNLDLKPGNGWTTLTTTVVEGLNIMEVVTADRIVGQIITVHPLEGYVPAISFLGTRFENLRIAGVPVELELDLDILGAKPEGDKPYSGDQGLIKRVAAQYAHIRGNRDLPADLHERYDQLSSGLGMPEVVECSLVTRASGDYPGHSFGHIIFIPDFGKISLGKVTVTHEDFDPTSGVPKKTTVDLTMMDLSFGCVINGGGAVGSGSSNGVTQP
jgi:hypothetical protein